MRAGLLELSDYIQLACFLEERTEGVYSSEFWQRRFMQWWECNPAMSLDAPRGWVLKDDQGGILGFLGNIPVKYADRGREAIAFSTTSWFVASSARNRGLDLFIPFMKQKALLFDTTASRKVQEVLPRLGFAALQRPWLSREAVFVSGCVPFLFFYIEKQLAGWKRVIVGTGTVLLAPILLLFLYLKRAVWLWAKPDYQAEVEDGFGKEYDTLWGDLSAGDRMLAVRRSRELEWFFGEDRDAGRCLVLGVRKDGVLQGYAAFKVIKRKFLMIQYACFEMTDLFLRDPDAGALRAILQRVYSFSRGRGLFVPYIKMFPVAGTVPVMNGLGCFWQTARDSFWYKDNRDQSLSRGDVVTSLFATPLDGDRPFFP